jgi:hypothetical protein
MENQAQLFAIFLNSVFNYMPFFDFSFSDLANSTKVLGYFFFDQSKNATKNANMVRNFLSISISTMRLCTLRNLSSKKWKNMRKGKKSLCTIHDRDRTSSLSMASRYSWLPYPRRNCNLSILMSCCAILIIKSFD